MAMPAAAPGPKYKAALSAAYAASLRVSEVVALKVSDIDSERLLLRIEQGRAARIALRCSPPGCWTCCATGIGERMRDLVQKWIAQVDRQRPGGGHHGIKLGIGEADGRHGKRPRWLAR